MKKLKFTGILIISGGFYTLLNFKQFNTVEKGLILFKDVPLFKDIAYALGYCSASSYLHARSHWKTKSKRVFIAHTARKTEGSQYICKNISYAVTRKNLGRHLKQTL